MWKLVLCAADDMFLNGAIQKNRYKKRLQAEVAELDESATHKFYVFYEKNLSDEMARLCDKYGTDKGEIRPEGHPYRWLSHSYADFYSRTYAHCREGVTKVFECGIGTNSLDFVSSMGVSGKPGASLRMWRDYFPNAAVYGGDIDMDILFEDERIRTYHLNQIDPQSIKKYWETVGETDFDLMIDDGLHTFEAGVCLFSHSIDRLSASGLYVIEDVLRDDLIKYKCFFDGKTYCVDYVTMFRPNVGLGDNSLVVIRKTS